MSWKRLLRKKSTWVWGAVTFGVAGLLIAFTVRATMGGPSKVPVFTNVDRGDVIDTVEATGTVDAVTTVNVGAQVSGTIDRIAVDFNSRVKKGQLLAHLEESLFVAAVKQARANLQAAQAATKMADAALESARDDQRVAQANLDAALAAARQATSDYQRAEKLFASGVAPAQDRDNAKSNVDSAQAAVQASQALVAQAAARIKSAGAALEQARANEKNMQAALEVAETNLSYTNIVSPCDGTVVARNVDVGQTVTSQLAAPNLFNIAEDLSHMCVYTKLEVHDVPRVNEGQKATFTVDAFPKLTFEGVVRQIRISPITSMKGDSVSPSKLPPQLSGAQTSIPGLQQQSSGTAQSPTGSSAGASASSGASASTGGGTTAASVSPSTVPAATQAPGLVQYDALIEFANTDQRLLPGMTAYVTIPVSAAYDVLRIRKEALGVSPPIGVAEKNDLLRRNGVQDGPNVVWLADGGTFKPVALKLGVSDYVYAQVFGTLEPGQRLLSGYQERSQ